MRLISILSKSPDMATLRRKIFHNSILRSLDGLVGQLTEELLHQGIINNYLPLILYGYQYVHGSNLNH